MIVVKHYFPYLGFLCFLVTQKKIYISFINGVCASSIPNLQPGEPGLSLRFTFAKRLPQFHRRSFVTGTSISECSILWTNCFDYSLKGFYPAKEGDFWWRCGRLADCKVRNEEIRNKKPFTIFIAAEFCGLAISLKRLMVNGLKKKEKHLQLLLRMTEENCGHRM